MFFEGILFAPTLQIYAKYYILKCINIGMSKRKDSSSQLEYIVAM